jgi:PadR family transcriptional regulator PadR
MATATNPSPLHDITAFQRDLLATVAGMDKPAGLDVKARLDDAYGQDLNHGRMYPALNDLVEMGLVDKGIKDRRTNEYVITERGRRELDAHHTWAANAMEGEV